MRTVGRRPPQHPADPRRPTAPSQCGRRLGPRPRLREQPDGRAPRARGQRRQGPPPVFQFAGRHRRGGRGAGGPGAARRRNDGRPARGVPRVRSHPRPQMRRLRRVERHHGEPARRAHRRPGDRAGRRSDPHRSAGDVWGRAAADEPGGLVDRPVHQQIVTLINDFKAYFIRHGQPIYENPSPGNVAGGLTTLEEKSLGAVQKGGQAAVTQVLRYGAPAATGAGGLALLESPGNDGVSSTALVASGATVLLFTTGRGTPLGFPVPTLKISSNTAIAGKKPHWIDLNAGAFLDGTATMDQLADDLFAVILDVASGRALANNEKHGYREIAIWKEGVTL